MLCYVKGEEGTMIITRRTIQLLRKRDEETFERVYEEYVNLVFYICYSITHDREASEDLTQDTFVKMMNSLSNYEECGKFKQYISQIARNLSKNYVTRNKTSDVSYDDNVISEQKDYNETSRVKTFIEENLDETSSRIVTLKIVHNFKFKEIAELLELSLGSVQSTYYQAIKTLKKEIR